jgi:glucokinase
MPESPTPSVAIGVDIGGRSAKLARIDRSGTIIERGRVPLNRSMCPDAVIEALAEGVGRLAAGEEEDANRLPVGVVMPGYLSADRMQLEFIANLPKLTGTAFPQELTDRLARPVRFDADGNAAALGEHWRGAGRGVRRLLVATLGTGIGGGVVIDGEILRVRNHNAGSLGHIIVNADGPRCACGARGCLEYYASAGGFERMAAGEADAEPDGLLAKLRKERGRLSIPELIEALRAGDAAAQRVVEVCGRWMATGIATWCSIYAPDLALLGGGVSTIGAPLLDAVREAFRDVAQPFAVQRTEIGLAALGNDAGVIGAAALWLAPA